MGNGARIVALATAGHRQSDIARRLGLSRQSVGQALRRNPVARAATVAPILAHCEWCGTAFERRRPDHRFCRDVCRTLASIRRRKAGKVSQIY